MTNHKRLLSGYKGKITPVQQKKLEMLKKASDKWQPQWIGDDDRVKYEVRCDGKKVSVNLGHNTCTCNVWQLAGMPCVHVISAIAWGSEQSEDYCHPWLPMSSFNAIYQHCIQPVLSEQY
nr:uncharacterized protein LOC112805230 [Arachis hypogaea]